MDGNCKWHLDSLLPFIPAVTVGLITTSIPPNEDNGNDIRLWPGNSHGDFSVASSYDLLSNFSVDPIKMCGKRFGNSRFLRECVRLFGWFFTIGSSLIKESIEWT